MKSTDMELQAIREKLQLLQAEPPAAETLALPWSESGRAVSTSGSVKQPFRPVPPAEGQRPEQDLGSQNSGGQNSGGQNSGKSPQEMAIEALKQRSRGSDQAANARIDNLVSQELYRLEVQASHINERSQQQAADIMALKRSAQQASVGLRRQGIHNHPQLAAITQFLESYESAVVPHIERDAQGHFSLTYDTVDFRQAEQDAVNTAHTLRNRRRAASPVPSQMPFSEPVATEHLAAHPKSSPSSTYQVAEDWMKAAVSSPVDTLTQLFGLASDQILGQTGSRRRRRRKRQTAFVPEGFDSELEGLQPGDWEEGMMDDLSADPAEEDDYSGTQFSWLDGAIWFSGAAIARIVVRDIAISYPIAQTVFLVALVGIITFALYQVVISKTNDYSLVYRLCIGMVGLFLAGLF